MDDWTFWGVALATVDILFASGITLHAVIWKRDSRAVIAWVGLTWLAPILGGCAYLCFGINRIERKARSLKGHDTNPPLEPQLRPDDRAQAAKLAEEHPQLIGLAQAGLRLSGLPIVPGNQVEPLINGDQAYPAMIEAIARAERSVTLASYIFDSDRAGDAFLKALVEARDRGVGVRVLVDDVGSKYSRPNMVRRLRNVGLTTATFLPTRLPRLPTYANLRNHRKLLVVDGKVGFTGGTNIREGHWLALEPSHPVHCLHFKLQGPIVAQLQKVFASDWEFTCGESLVGEDWFPVIDRSGSVWARGIEDGPDEHFEKLTDMIAAALASARRRVRIVTPYFLPSSSLILALNVTALRGVNVEVYLPSQNNLPVVQWAATAQLWQILEKGCRVYYTAPPFDHTKVLIIDDLWTLIGSTNWDPRSLRLNFEFNVECYDEQLAQQVNAIVDEKARSAQEIKLEDVNRRPVHILARDGLARLLTPYL